MNKSHILDGTAVPFRGGMDTRREKSLIPIGGFSSITNMRNRHPGLEQRKGMTYHHSTAYSTTKFLRYDQITGSFAAADSLVGGTSGATATVVSVFNLGNSEGLLALSGITGTFQDNEVIYVASYGSNILTNGDCELDANWANYGTPTTNERSIEQAHGDTYSRKVIADSPGDGVSNLTFDSTPELNVFYRMDGYVYISALTGDGVRLLAQISGEAALGQDETATTGSWQQLTNIFRTTSALDHITAYLTGSTGTGTFYIDDVTIRKITNAAYANGTAVNSPHSLYQFSKGKRNEKHFFAQMRDGTLLKATNNPPTTTTGAFGSSVHSGSINDLCASYSDINDILIYSNGEDQHQLYAGTANPVLAFMKYDSSETPALWPVTSIDYTRQVTDGDSTTVAVLDSLNTFANHECIFIATPIPANRLTWTITAANGTAAVGTLSYRKSDNTWADTTETDGTASGGATLAVSESMTWASPSDEIPITMFGISAYWYRWETATQLDAEVEVSGVTYGSGFGNLTNVWNGRKDYVIDAVFDDDAESIQYNYSGDSITIDAMTTADILCLSSYDPLQGIYIDVGSAPNTTTTTTIADVKYWNGAAWTSLTETDFTAGLNQSGWILWNRLAFGTEMRRRIAGSPVEAYWYQLTIGVATTSTMNVAIYGMPYFDINDFGKGGVSGVWKDRAVYTFDKYPSYLYVSEKYRPNVLNGDDFAILEAGDGRSNRVVCIKKFHNELLVYQQEQGRDGGCITIFEGYSPTTFGKLLLSSKVGTFSPKSVVVVDGVLTSGETEDKFRTEAYSLSHYGVCMTDGLTVQVISDDVGNYFDPASSDCIRRGYETEMWIEHDSAYNVLRVGLVTGTSATTCNTFLIYDLVDKTWAYDTYGQNLSCMTEVEADSGDVPILQYGGGTDDGAVYRLNTGTNDVDITPTTTAINAFSTIELSYKGFMLQLRRLILRMKARAAGDCTVTLYRRGVADSSTLTLSMTAEITSDGSRRHDVGVKSLKGDQLSVKFQNNTASQELYLLDVGFDLFRMENR